MSDQSSSGFSVVDKRTATGEASPVVEEKAETGEASLPTAATTTTDTDLNVNSTSPFEDASEASQDADTDSTPESNSLPDPTWMLTLASMQMDVRTLVTALAAVFDGHAWRAMGLVPNPLTGEAQKDLPEAQIAIDCVQFLLSKIETHLPEPERREAQRRLSDLRMNYLAKLREG